MPALSGNYNKTQVPCPSLRQLSAKSLAVWKTDHQTNKPSNQPTERLGSFTGRKLHTNYFFLICLFFQISGMYVPWMQELGHWKAQQCWACSWALLCWSAGRGPWRTWRLGQQDGLNIYARNLKLYILTKHDLQEGAIGVQQAMSVITDIHADMYKKNLH